MVMIEDDTWSCATCHVSLMRGTLNPKPYTAHPTP
jgi:ferredoxin